MMYVCVLKCDILKLVFLKKCLNNVSLKKLLWKVIDFLKFFVGLLDNIN